MLDSPASPAPAMSPKDFLHKGSFHDAGRAATDSSDNNVDGAIIEEARVRQCLAEERMNRTMSLPECMCLRLPRVVSYAEVGDPGGYPVRISHQWLCSFVSSCRYSIPGIYIYIFKLFRWVALWSQVMQRNANTAYKTATYLVVMSERHQMSPGVLALGAGWDDSWCENTRATSIRHCFDMRRA